MAERLHVILARAGVASRREAERLIRDGRVMVNGEVILRPGAQVVWGQDAIHVDNRPIRKLEPKVVIMLNKPKRVVTTCHDPAGRPTISELVREVKARLFYVGRLDYHSEGLLIMTNDGDLAQRLQHPRYGIPKTYLTKVKGTPGTRALERLRSGIMLDRRRTAPARVEKTGTTGANTWLEITIKEGRNRQVRRMCEAVGHPALKLKRIQYGPIRLGNLKPGSYRHLTPGEIESLQKCIGEEALSKSKKSSAPSKSRLKAAKNPPKSPFDKVGL
ncbi:MAG: rRNA pseudouridine synthase [Desulfobacterales bacterium]|nr:rRNA pseudouridine synthase [Desulfobacterales bacterium]